MKLEEDNIQKITALAKDKFLIKIKCFRVY